MDLSHTVPTVPRSSATDPGHGRASDGDDRESLADAEIASYVARAQSRSLANVPALSAFQRRMEQYPQLSPEAQLELTRDYQKGMAAKAKIRDGGLRGVQERRAQAAVRRGEYAIEYLVASNLKLVLLIARENAEERFGRERAADMLPDLVGEANLALTEAVVNYDVERCPVFSSYAARVIRDRVRMMLTKEGPLRLAPSWNRLKRIASVRMPALAAELGRQPTEEEVKADLLAKCLEWAEAKLTPEQRHLSVEEQHKIKIAKLRKQGMLGAIDNLADVLLATQSVASLDAPVGEGAGSSLGDLLSEGETGGMFEDVELDQLRSDLAAALATLPERDREIVRLRYGFVDNETWTYARISEQYGVTAERIRQIERNVLAKLAAPHAQRDALAAHLPTQFDTFEG